MSSRQILEARLEQVELIVESRRQSGIGLDLTVLSDAELLRLDEMITKGWDNLTPADWEVAEPILEKADRNSHSSPCTLQERPVSASEDQDRKSVV